MLPTCFPHASPTPLQKKEKRLLSELNSCMKEERGRRPGLLAPNSPYDLCGRKATLKPSHPELRSCVKGKFKKEVDVPNSPYGLCGLKQH